ncbi:hypothetical protein BN2476_170202 [Paraburkholderia piptadeniae]|uniref:Uncharacterized protein n=1 Tax=Paraburkholderia piptadeniae TaxID=1701573 RepID=A0A1N7RU32_9BURK|nr:hypothetical protein BN2476_170202 [Paraburkholderia piptadeniae]
MNLSVANLGPFDSEGDDLHNEFQCISFGKAAFKKRLDAYVLRREKTSLLSGRRLNHDRCFGFCRNQHHDDLMTVHHMSSAEGRHGSLQIHCGEIVARGLSAVLIAPLDRPTLRRFDSVRVGGIVTEVTRILHFYGFTASRVAPINLRAGVVATAFIERRRVDMELLVVEPHGRLRKGALLVALDKLRAPRCVWTGVHQLVPVVAARTNEKKSALVGLGFDLIEGETRIAVSASPHGYLRRRFRRLGGCRGSEGRRGNSELLFIKQLLSKSARRVPRLILVREISFGFVQNVRFGFGSHFSQMNDSPISACNGLHHTNSCDVRVGCVDFIVHDHLPFTLKGIVA